MDFRRARREDLPAIHELMHRYGHKMGVGEEHINHRDIALILRHDDGQAIAFLWIGLMAQNKVGYIDKFAVHPDWAGKKVGNAMALAAYRELNKRKVREVFGVIRQDKWHDKSAMNALKMAFSAHRDPYTYVETNLDFVKKELKLPEE